MTPERKEQKSSDETWEDGKGTLGRSRETQGEERSSLSIANILCLKKLTLGEVFKVSMSLKKEMSIVYGATAKILTVGTKIFFSNFKQFGVLVNKKEHLTH